MTPADLLALREKQFVRAARRYCEARRLSTTHAYFAEQKLMAAEDALTEAKKAARKAARKAG